MFFQLCPFSGQGSNPVLYIVFSFFFFFSVSSNLWQCLSLALSFMTLRFLKNIGQIFCRTSLNGSLSNSFSWLDWGSVFLARKPQKRLCALLSTWGGVIRLINLIFGDVNLSLGDVGFLPGFSTIKLLFFP